jgi:hypothetical protein
MELTGLKFLGYSFIIMQINGIINAVIAYAAI